LAGGEGSVTERGARQMDSEKKKKKIKTKQTRRKEVKKKERQEHCLEKDT